MSYHEKNTTVSLVTQMLIAGYYLFSLFRQVQQGPLVAERMYGLWALVIFTAIFSNIFASILSNILLTILEAIRSGEYTDPRFIADERDQLIELKGTRASYLVFSIGVLGAVLAFIFGQPALIMVSVIFFCAILAEMLGDLTKIILYRRER